MRIESFSGAAANSSKTGSDMLSKLKPGDNVRAQILENSGNELTLKFSDGSIVSAAAARPVEAAEGEFVNLTFTGTMDDKPAFEVTQRSIQPQTDSILENLKNRLVSLKLPLNEQNISIAQALVDKELPVTLENMAKMAGLIKGNPELKPDAAAFLTAFGLTQDSDSIVKLQQLLSGRLKLSDNLSQLIKLLTSQLKPDTEAFLASPQVIKLLEKLAARLENSSNIAVLPTSQNANPKSQTENITPFYKNSETEAAQNLTSSSKSLINNTQSNINNQNRIISNAILDSDVEIINKQDSQNSNNILTGTDSKSNANTNTNANINTNANTINTTTHNTNSQHSKINENNTNSEISTLAAKSLNSSNNEISINSSNNEHGISSANKNTVIIENNPRNIAERLFGLLKGQIQPDSDDLQLLQAFDKELSKLINSDSLSKEELSAAKQLASSEVKVLAAVNILKTLSITVDENHKEINPVKLYNDMESSLQAIKSALQQLPHGIREAAVNMTGSFESNLSFINQLNNYSSYVQLPLSIFSQNATGELYMLKRGAKTKKLDPSNMTVLLSLETNNIGRVDTLLSIDKKNIITNFRLEDTQVFPVLKEYHKQLFNSLLEKGFRLVDFTYRLKDEPINITNFEAEAKKEFIKNSNNIDIVI